MRKIETIHKESKRAKKAALDLTEAVGTTPQKTQLRTWTRLLGRRSLQEPGGTPKGQDILVYFKKMVNKEKMEVGLTFC